MVTRIERIKLIFADKELSESGVDVATPMVKAISQFKGDMDYSDNS